MPKAEENLRTGLARAGQKMRGAQHLGLVGWHAGPLPRPRASRESRFAAREAASKVGLSERDAGSKDNPRAGSNAGGVVSNRPE